MNSREIEKLRRKFIAIAMASIFVAMAFIGFMVNVLTYSISRFSIDRMLNTLIMSVEELDERELNYGVTFEDIFVPAYDRNAYYVLSFDETGELQEVYNNLPNSEETQLVKSYAETLLQRSFRSGQYNGYYYKIVTHEDGAKTIAFLESSVIIATQLRTLYLTLMLFFLGLVLTFFLVRHFSLRAIQPEIRNAESQKQFITNASHELKTPLAVIRANTDMIEMTQGESEWTQSTLKQVDHLNGMIQNLVTIAKAQEREDRTALSEIDASGIISESVDPYESLAQQSGKTIVREIADDVKLTADESKLRQLATILLDNAMKYCDENGTIRVALSSAKNGKGLQLTVSNDYADGKDVDCSRFFDRFYREDSSHNIDKGGYGIGLSIAESIRQQYNGSIQAEWKDGVISFQCVLK